MTNANYVITNSYQQLQQVDSAEAQVFKPDISIVDQEENIQKPTTTPQAVKEKNNSILIVALFVLLAVVLSFAIRLGMNYAKAQSMDHERIKQQSMTVDHHIQDGTQNFSARKKMKKMDETEMLEMATTNKKLVGWEMQYDATQDFSIFGLDMNNKVAALEKINNADKKLFDSYNEQESGSTAEKKDSSESQSKMSNNLPEDREISDE